MKPKYTGILEEYGDGPGSFREETFVLGTTVYDLKPGDLVYIRLPGPYSYIVKAEFIKLVKTALHAKVVGCTKGISHLGTFIGKEIKVRYTNAYLWGKNYEIEKYPVCHWFVAGGQCV